MKKGKNNKVFLSLAYTILIFGIFFILWIKYGNASLPEAVVGAIVPSAIANFIIPSDINLIVLIKELLEVLGNKEQDVDFGIREKGVKYIIGTWVIGFLAVSCFVVGYIANKWNMIPDVPVLDAEETAASDTDNENIEDAQNDRMSDDEDNADVKEDAIQQEPLEAQDVSKYAENDETADTEIEKAGASESPSIADSKESFRASDFIGEHVTDNRGNDKIENLENLKPLDSDKTLNNSGVIADETPDDLGLSADVSPGESGPIADVSSGESRPAADASPGESGPAADASPGESGPVADVSPGESGPIADVSPGVSGPIADASPGISGPIADTSPGASGPIADVSPGVSGPIVDVTPGISGPNEDMSSGNLGPGIDADEVPNESDSIETKPEEIQPSEPDDNVELPIQRNDYIVPPIEKKEGEVAHQPEKEKTVTKEEADDITILSGETKIIDKIYHAGQERRYCFRPEISGTYYLKIISAKDCAEYNVSFRGENNEKEDGYSYTFEDVISEEILPVNMNAGEDYLICIKQPWGFGGYDLYIKYPNNAEDISDYNSFRNYLCYPKEEHVYLMIPKRTGSYRFDILGIAEDKDICISICREGEEDKEYVGNKDGLTIEHMQADVAYKIIISQNKGFSPYDLRIGWQKETISLDGYTGAQDSIQYQDQLNKYEFIPEESGTCYFQVLDIKDDLAVDIVIFDEEGKEIDSCHCTSEGTNGLAKHVKKGEHLTIGVRGMKGTGDYILDYKICPDDELKTD